jgi:hypothetical protein
MCPYLDLTFHRARQRLGRDDARTAFLLGFGCFFLLMILFTLRYSPHLASLLYWGHPRGIPVWMVRILATYMVLQSAFTVAVHLSEVLPERCVADRGMVLLCAAAAILFPLLLGLAVRKPDRWLGLEDGEFIYRLFMSFYALIFPAYVWLWTARSGSQATMRQRWALVALVSLLAAPFYWMGLMRGQWNWLLPGLVIILLARLLPRPLASRRNGTRLQSSGWHGVKG